MDFIISLTGSLIWIALSLAVIFFSVVGIVTIVENWIENGKKW
tara:strand:+ start:1301 stop:1429 length:129 start_codon:yes stop_codon:yes gene_type:complete